MSIKPAPDSRYSRLRWTGVSSNRDGLPGRASGAGFHRARKKREKVMAEMSPHGPNHSHRASRCLTSRISCVRPRLVIPSLSPVTTGKIQRCIPVRTSSSKPEKWGSTRSGNRRAIPLLTREPSAYTIPAQLAVPPRLHFNARRWNGVTGLGACFESTKRLGRQSTERVLYFQPDTALAKKRPPKPRQDVLSACEHLCSRQIANPQSKVVAHLFLHALLLSGHTDRHPSDGF